MRRVWTRYGILPLVLLIAASFLFIGRGVPEVDASAFAPTLTASLVSSGAGATSDINETADFGTSPVTGTRTFPASSVYFTPAGWGIPDCSPTAACPYAFNEKTGDFTSTTTFGILNSQCAVAVGVGFVNGMRNASTDPTDSIAPGAGFAALNADADFSGAPDGTEHWNDLLNNLIGVGLLPSTPPRERQILSTVALGTPVWVDVLTYDPGLLGGPATAPLGYATTFILENANPTNPPAPGLITDTCGLFNAFTQAGLASGGATHRSNPGPGTNIFFFNAGGQRDADQGPSAPAEPTLFPLPGGLSGFGQWNSIDTCPFTPNHGSVLAPAGAPFNGDLFEAPGDGIDSACDAGPVTFDGSDVDTDSYLNRGDNCPYAPNGLGFGGLTPGTNNQQDLSEVLGPPAANEVGPQPVDGGPGSDSIGDDCDLNLQVPDGHFHAQLLGDPVCITGGPFSDAGDGDGWCDIEEGALGSSPASAASTPETLAVPGTCSDGADNDGDLATDLADTGCQLPLHDLGIRKINGETTTGGASSCQPNAPSGCGYNIILQNFTGAPETAQLGVLIDPIALAGPPAQSSGGCSGPSAIVHGGSAQPTMVNAGPINIDGDADVEWLLKATVTIKANGQANANVGIFYPTCGAPLAPTAADYTVTVDICHDSDIAPLGLFGAGPCTDGASDGGMDTNTANDAPVTKVVDDVTR